MKTIKTVRDLTEKYPALYDYYYKWRNTENPELEKNIDELLEELGYELEDKTIIDEYNDIKGYLDCKIKVK